MICTANRKTEIRERSRLLARHARQLAPLTDDDVAQRADMIAVTFRPGNRTASFYNNTLRPVGSAVAVVLSYDEHGREIALGGFRAVDAADGHIRYGGNGKPEFQFDVRPEPTRRDPRARLFVDRNPSLVELAMRMDHIAAQRIPASLGFYPMLPRIVLGFAPDLPPQYLPTEKLSRVAAERAGVSLRKLESNPPDLVDRLLRQTWEEIVTNSTARDPQTGLLLVDAEICHAGHRPLRVFEDFQHLIGDWTWNPSRVLDIASLPNNAAARLADAGVQPECLEAVAQETIDALLAKWRQDLGDQSGLFSDEDFYDALLAPNERLTACSTAIPKMRKRLTTYWNETATDFDLRRAVKAPYDALFASGACRVQVLRRREVPNPLTFSEADLGRRIDVDWRPIVWPSQNLPNTTSLAA